MLKFSLLYDLLTQSNTGPSVPVGYLPMTPSAGDDIRQVS